MEGSSTEMEQALGWLQADFARRRQVNERYSVRAYAKDLSVSPGALSQILAKKRPLTLKQAKKFAERLKSHGEGLRTILGATAKQEPAESFRHVEDDVFRLIADWYHYAILSLLETSSPPSSAGEFAERLGLDQETARSALARLKRLRLVNRIDGKWVLDTEGLTSTHDVPNAALRKMHRQILGKAADAIEAVALDERSVTMITFASSPQKLAQAKQKIRQFRRSLAKFMEDGEKTEVYTLAVQLFPLSKPYSGGDHDTDALRNDS